MGLYNSAKIRGCFLLSVLFLAVLVRLNAIGYNVLWWDELFSWWTTTLNWTGFFNVSFHDVNPPFYYFLLRVWSFLFGQGEMSLRILSLCFSGLTLVYVYLTARLYDIRTGFYAMLIVAFSAFHINYSIEVRSYSLMAMLGIMSLYHFLKLYNDGKGLDKVIYLVSTVLAIYTHVYGLFILIAQIVFVADKYRHDKNTGLAKIVIYPFLASLPLIFHYVYRGFLPLDDLDSRDSWWLESPGVPELLDALELFSSTESFMPLFVLLTLLTIYSFKKKDEEILNQDLTKILWLYIICVILLPWIISYLVIPIFRPRYLIAGVIPLYILTAYGISQIPDVPIQIMILSAILAVSMVSVNQTVYEEDVNEPWPELVEDIEKEYIEGDKIVYSGHWIRFGFDKYGDEELNMVSVPGKHMYDAEDNYRFQTDQRNVINSTDIKRMEQEIEGADRIWLILLRERGEVHDLKRNMENDFQEKELREYGDINVTLYEQRVQSDK